MSPEQRGVNVPEGNQGSPEEIQKGYEMLEGQPIQKRLSDQREQKAKYMESINAHGLVTLENLTNPSEEDAKKYGEKPAWIDVMEGEVNGRKFTVRRVKTSKGYAFDGSVEGLRELNQEAGQKLWERYEPAAMISTSTDGNAEPNLIRETKMERARMDHQVKEKERAAQEELVLKDLLG